MIAYTGDGHLAQRHVVDDSLGDAADLDVVPDLRAARRRRPVELTPDLCAPHVVNKS